MTPEALARAMAEKLLAWDLRFQPATTASNALLPYAVALIGAREALRHCAHGCVPPCPHTRQAAAALVAIDALLPEEGEGERER